MTGHEEMLLRLDLVKMSVARQISINARLRNRAALLAGISALELFLFGELFSWRLQQPERSENAALGTAAVLTTLATILFLYSFRSKVIGDPYSSHDLLNQEIDLAVSSVASQEEALQELETKRRSLFFGFGVIALLIAQGYLALGLYI